MRLSRVTAAGAVVLGALAWCLEALIDWVFFYEGPLLEILLTNVPGHDAWMRSLLVLVILIFGAIMAWILDREERREGIYRDSVELYGSLYASMNEGVAVHRLVCDEDGRPVDYRILDVNPAYERILDISRETAVGALASELYAGDEAPLLDTYTEVVRTGKSAVVEIYYEPFDRYFRISAFSLSEERFATVFADATERHRAEERDLIDTVAAGIGDMMERRRVEHETDVLARFPAENPMPVLRVGREGVVDYANEAAERVLERLGSALGRPVPSEWQNAITDAARNGEGGQLEIEVGDRSLLITIAPVPEYRYVNVYGVEVTELRRAQRELQALTEDLEARVRDRTAQLQAANAELETFAYSVSHDLRAPLRAIDGFSKAVLEDYGDRLDETGTDYLRRVRAATQRMAELIDDMLQLSRITRAELRMHRVDMSVVAAEIIDELRAGSPERSVHVEIEPDMTVDADRRLLMIALRNLLGNAWKFTAGEEDPVIEFSSRREDSGRTIYRVSDNGAGFDMEYAPKLFQPFQRLHREDEFPGTGVGLATVRRIIRRHGGDIWAEAEVGQGAAFYFSLHDD